MSVFGDGVRRVCAVVAAETATEARRQVRESLQLTPTVELRLDWMKSDWERQEFLDWLRSAKRAGRSAQAQFIATCRRVLAGGRFRGDVEAEIKWLAKAVDAGCQWCDLEIESLRKARVRQVVHSRILGKILVSEHNFRCTPASFGAPSLRRYFTSVKVAAQANRIADSIRVLKLAHNSSSTVTVPMGDIGLPGRLLALREGSALAYAPVSAATAPGQVALTDFVDLYRAHRLTRATRVYGVIGNPIAHSLSPLMHNTGFVARGLDAVYLPFLVESLPDFLRAIAEFGIRGFSVTLPYKRSIMRWIDDYDAVAAEIGAVNTVLVRSGGSLKGFNTDHIGVLRALEKKMKLQGKRILVFGAGGAARAAGFAVSHAGAQVLICARREQAAKDLAKRVQGEAITRKLLMDLNFDAIINATPIGMHPKENESPLSERELNCEVVMDLIYRPLQTKLLKMASRLGIAVVSGVEMFLAQGLAQWELWNKSKPPGVQMRRVVLRALKASDAQSARK